MILEVIGSFVSGLFHTLGTRFAGTLIGRKNKKNREDISDQETWNIITCYGKYSDVWEIYRNKGLIEAIKARDEKVDFDHRLELGRIGNDASKFSKETHQLSHIDAHYSPKPQEYRVNDSDRSQALDNLDLALIRGLSSYFETMSGKIRHYHKSHKASEEEAEVIANYFLEIGRKLMKVKTQADLKVLLTSLESLKEKVSRYQHESYKYRWSTSLEKDVITKVRKVVDSFQS
jgi:hypothetical protein